MQIGVHCKFLQPIFDAQVYMRLKDKLGGDKGGEDTAEQYHQYSFAEPRQYQRGNCSGGGASRVSRCGQHIGEDQSAQNGKGYIVKE